VYYRPENDPRFPYQDQINVQQDGESLAFIKLYPLASQTAGANEAFDYAICLHANAMQSSQAGRPRIMLSCTNGVCTPDRPGYVVSVDCDAKGAKTDGKASNSGAVIPVVLAAEQVQRSRESGWDVPSAEILEKMTDRERIGYTLFSVDFTPQGEAAQADSYYYELRANGQPIYIDGLSPGLKKESLQKGTVNHISFALENLNFSGQFDGYEKLHLTIFFVKGNTEIYHQDLDRDYVALRDAAEIPPLQTAVGTFRWTGKYIVPRNENKYELLLASADCGDPPGKSCIDRAVYAKSRFDKARFSFDDKPTVMVIRPPLRKPPAYGLALGVVQPTSQVQFTFNASEVGELCRWAVDHVGQGKGGNVIQSDLRRYDVATRGYAPCK
jgi:hypothetical protein